MSYTITCKVKKNTQTIGFIFFFFIDLFHRLVLSIFIPLFGCFNYKQWERGMVEVGVVGKDWSLVLSWVGEEKIVATEVVLLLV
jgi:hypothetical protein